jgi:hypothetical protein
MRVRILQIPKAQEGLELQNPQLAELEQGEIYEDINGDISKISDSAPTHDDGGVLVDDAHRILEDTSDKRTDYVSKELKLSPEEIFNVTGFKPKSSLTHSKAFEVSSEYWDRKYKHLEKKVKDTLDYAADTNSTYAKNSLDFNNQQLTSIPSKQELFDNLFEYQEKKKEQMNALNNNNMFATGGAKSPYKVKPEGYGDLTKMADAIKAYNEAAGTNFTSIAQVQKHRTETYPELTIDYYKNQGINPTNKHVKLLGTNDIDFSQVADDKILEGDYDKLWGNRQLIPTKKKFKNEDEWFQYLKMRPVVTSNGKQYVYEGGNTYTTPEYEQGTTPPPAQQPSTPPSNTTEEPSIQPSQRSRFNEPLRWYDVAHPIENLINSDRIPVRYDIPEITYSQPKYQNPLPTLQGATADYNTILQKLPANAVGYGNAASVYSSKYNTDNQVLAQYDNINNDIYNKTRLYEDQMRNQQSANDYAARQQFEQKYLNSLEKQRQQRALSRGDIYNTLAKNRVLNREGNLAMQMFNFFDENGNYTGNPYVFNSLANQNNPIRTDPKTGQKWYVNPETKIPTKLK